MTRPRGRPPLPPERRCEADLSLNLTNRDYDALYALARQEDVTVQVIIRRILAAFLRAPRPRTRRTVTLLRRLGL